MREHESAARRVVLGGTIVLLAAVTALAVAAATLLTRERSAAREQTERQIRTAFESFVRSALEEPDPELEFSTAPGFVTVRKGPHEFARLEPAADPETRFLLAEADRTDDPRLAKAAVQSLLDAVDVETRIAAAARWARADLRDGGIGVPPGFWMLPDPGALVQPLGVAQTTPGRRRFVSPDIWATARSGVAHSREALLVRRLAEHAANGDRLAGDPGSATATLRAIAARAPEPDASSALAILVGTPHCPAESELQAVRAMRKSEREMNAALAVLRAAADWALDGTRVRVAPLDGGRLVIGRAGSDRCMVRTVRAASAEAVRRRTLDPVGARLVPGDMATSPGVALAVAAGWVVRKDVGKDVARPDVLLTGIAVAAAAAVAAFAFFVRAVRREAAAAAARADFVATVSHELRTPVAVMRTAAETLLAGRAPRDEDRTRLLEAVLRESERLSGLVGNVLDFSRIDAGTRRYTPRTTSVEDLVEETVRRAAAVLGPAGLRVDVEIPAALPPIDADADALGAALANLLDNAAKFRGTSDTATVRATADADRVVIDVIDHGLGVPDAEKPHVFDRFFRGADPRVRETRGSGIGLSLVRHTVEAHGGHVEVRDTAGGGATFRIILPLPRNP